MLEYVNGIQNTEPSELEPILVPLVTIALTTKPKDKDLTRLLGQMAIVTCFQQKQTQGLLQRSAHRLKSQHQEVTRLQNENKV